MRTRTLTLECPICAEDLSFTESDLEELYTGDILVCNACHTELEVIESGEDLQLAPLAAWTVCPQCSEEIELDDAQLEQFQATCPLCHHTFELIADDPI